MKPPEDDRELKVYQSLWAMQPAKRDGRLRRLPESIEMIAEAGFDGVGIDLWAIDMAGARGLRDQLKSLGLGVILTAFPNKLGDMPELLSLAADLDVDFLNIVGRVMPVNPSSVVPVIYRWIEMAAKAGIPIQFETHRYSMTNDLLATLRLLDDVPEMAICADLSHYVVGRELDFPLDVTTQGQFSRILERSESFQGRVANRQQVQVPFRFPQHRDWYDRLLQWWQVGFRSWRNRNPSGAGKKLIFLCELGPPDYAITDADGVELSDRWEEALELRQAALSIWNDLVAQARA
jgi:hypothetical protein